jgi:hypothetical protein
MLTIAGMSNGLRQDAAAEKKADKEEQKARQQTTLSNMADETMNSIDQLIVDKTGQSDRARRGDQVYRGWSSLARLVADSGLIPKATAAKAALDNLKSRLVIDLIGEMKSQSKTGATGFGQLNDRGTSDPRTLDRPLGHRAGRKDVLHRTAPHPR